MNLQDTISNLQLYFQDNKLLLGIFIFCLTIVIGYIIKFILIFSVSRVSKFTRSKVDDVVLIELKKIPFWLIVFTGMYLGLVAADYKDITPQIQRVINVLFYIVWALYIVRFINRAIVNLSKKYISRVEDRSLASAYSYLTVIIRFFIWIVGILFILSNLGYDVSAFIAGLGIGGLAIALALQNMIKDLFSAFVIILDKPIRIGDYVDFGGDTKGTVKSIGIRSTRITGEDHAEIVMPNGDLINKVVKNYKNGMNHHITLNLSLAEDKDVAKIVNDLKEIFEHEGVSTRTIEIFLSEINPDQRKYKVSIILKRIERDDLTSELQKLTNQIYDKLKKAGYGILSLSVEEPV